MKRKGVGKYDDVGRKNIIQRTRTPYEAEEIRVCISSHALPRLQSGTVNQHGCRPIKDISGNLIRWELFRIFWFATGDLLLFLQHKNRYFKHICLESSKCSGNKKIQGYSDAHVEKKNDG